MRCSILAAPLLGAALLCGASASASAQTPVERARRQLDEGVRQDRFLDAARDARGDVRSGAGARADDLDADRAPLITNRALEEGSRPSSSPITPVPSLGDNVQR